MPKKEVKDPGKGKAKTKGVLREGPYRLPKREEPLEQSNIKKWQ